MANKQFNSVDGYSVGNAVVIIDANGNVSANTLTVSAVANITGNLTSGNANLGNLAKANFFQGDGGLLTNIAVTAGTSIVNGTSNVSVGLNGNVTVGVSGNANIMVVTGTGVNIAGTLNATGNSNVGNLGTSGNITAGYFLGNGSQLTGISASFPLANGTSNIDAPVSSGNINISVGGTPNVLVTTTTGVNVSGTLNATGNITGGNLSGTLVTGTLTTAAQPNITSVGTLTGLGVNGNITAANIIANTGVFYGNGSGLSAIAGANVTGTVANATYATSAGSATTATSATTAGTVTTNAQPNITSVGTLTSLGVSGNITAPNIIANTGVFYGNGSGLTQLTGANVTGTVPSATSATTAGTVTTNAQPNITSVGTLTSLSVTGNITGDNLIANTNIYSPSITTIAANGNLTIDPNGSGNLVITSTTPVVMGNTLNVTGNTTSGNVSTGILTANAASQTYTAVSISANTLTLNLAAASVFGVTLNNNITTLTLNNVTASGATASFVLQFTADGTARTVAWPASFRWPNGTAPTLTSTLNKVDVIVAYTDDGGTNWYAFISGQNL